jgi:hypothetical protein
MVGNAARVAVKYTGLPGSGTRDIGCDVGGPKSYCPPVGP